MGKTLDPAMHTAEHILNQTMVRKFGCGRAFSAHIERKKSKCDYRFHRALSAEEEADIAFRVNEVIRADLPVTTVYLAVEDARRRFDLDRLPPGAGDRIRIVGIGDFDACPCIGPHLVRSGEIPGFRIVSTSFSDPVLRIRFKLDPGAASKLHQD
jgi:misacylated tRNA(Ala) deacylase